MVQSLDPFSFFLIGPSPQMKTSLGIGWFYIFSICVIQGHCHLISISMMATLNQFNSLFIHVYNHSCFISHNAELNMKWSLQSLQEKWQRGLFWYFQCLFCFPKRTCCSLSETKPSVTFTLLLSCPCRVLLSWYSSLFLCILVKWLFFWSPCFWFSDDQAGPAGWWTGPPINPNQ